MLRGQHSADRRELVAQIVDQAGKHLGALYGDAPIPKAEIVEEVRKRGGPPNMQPSDYCYNRVNADPISCNYPVFEYLGRSQYRYLGLNCKDYSGLIFWKPQGQSQERVVGQCKNGIPYLDHDPRRG